MAEIGLFDYIKMISLTKEMPEFDEHFEKVYQPFLVNRFFSLCADNSVVIANLLNKNYEMSKKNHFLFLSTMIRKGKRYNKWPKKQTDERVKFIMEEYDYSYKRAKEASFLITDEQILEMRQAYDQGGTF
jgi:hypothetical protein